MTHQRNPVCTTRNGLLTRHAQGGGNSADVALRRLQVLRTAREVERLLDPMTAGRVIQGCSPRPRPERSDRSRGYQADSRRKNHKHSTSRPREDGTLCRTMSDSPTHFL